MFSDKYNSALNEVSPDEKIKQKILNSINENQVKPKLHFKRAAITSVAVAASMLIVITSGFLGIKTGNLLNAKLSAPKNYEEIYKAVKKSAKSSYFLLEDEAVDVTVAEGNFNMYAKTESQTATDQTNDDHSDTTVQVEGVDEADLVKTDGKYIYKLDSVNSTFTIIKAGKKPTVESETDLTIDRYFLYEEMYLYENYVVFFYDDCLTYKNTLVAVYNVSDVKNPVKVHEFIQRGDVETTRLIGGTFYLLTNYGISREDIEKDEPETYVPTFVCNQNKSVMSADDILISPNHKNAAYTVICAYDISDGKVISDKALFCNTYTVYCSKSNIILASIAGEETVVYRYSISKEGKIQYCSEGKIRGSLLNQFSIDEYNDYFRFVTTATNSQKVDYEFTSAVTTVTSNSLYVLDKNLKQVGKVENIAPGERVYSVRFMGDTAYFVTFRQIDPLFSVDLSNPKEPKIIGALKIPGFSDYLFPFGEGKLFGIGQDADEKTGQVGNVKISMFDISNPANVTEEAKEILFSNYSESLFTHKATFINKNKNLIGFPMTDYSYDTTSYYMIYSYENGKFVQKAKVNFGKTFENLRGLYIGEEFYIISDDTLYVYNISDFSKVAEIKI